MKKIVLFFLYIFIFTIPIENIIIYGNIGTIAKITGFIAILLVLFYSLMFRGFKIQSFHIIGFLFVFWGVITYFWGYVQYKAVTRSITYLGLVAMTVALFQFRNQNESFMKAYVVGALLGVLEEIREYLLFGYIGYIRFSAPNFNPNEFAFYLIIAIFFAAYLIMFTKTWLEIIYYLSFIVLSLYGVFLTGSRAGVGGLVFFGFYISLSLIKSRKENIVLIGKKVLFLSIIVGIIFFSFKSIPKFLYHRFLTTPLEVTEGDLNTRKEIWNSSIKMFEDHPLFGVGRGSFRYSIEAYSGFQKVAHNTFIGILCEEGIIGFTIFLILLLLCVIKIINIKNNERRKLFIFLFAMTIFMSLTHSLHWKKGYWLVLSLIINEY